MKYFIILLIFLSVQSVLSDSTNNKISYKDKTSLSFGTGAGTYNFPNLYFIEGNVQFPIGQSFYIKTGLIFYDDITYDDKESIPYSFYVNLYFLHRWQVSSKFHIWGGGGIYGSPVGGVLFNLDVLSSYTITKSLALALELKQGLNFRKQVSKYIKYPLVSLNLIITL